MQYRVDKQSGSKLSILGLGCMRFPPGKAETERMVLTAIDGGVNYFDTAYVYPSSEATLGGILAGHGKRKDVYISTKLPLMLLEKTANFDKYFEEQLRRLRTDYIDYYMMHNMTSFSQWDALRRQGIERWAEDKKAAGRIRRIGFSFHGSGDEFHKILDACPWEFCMLQHNYYDVNYQAGRKGVRAAAEKGIPVMVMEPMLGGKLAAGLPKQAAALFQAADPSRTPADWALRWLWNQDGVTTIPSGMSSVRQMEQNIRAAREFTPLTGEELAVYDQVVVHFRKSFKIPCTGCDYCMPCPQGINIPSCFSAYNTSYAQGYFTGAKSYMMTTGAVRKVSGSPRRCNGCGKCEPLCPQDIRIRESLKKVAGRMEPLPVRAGMAMVRAILSRM
jgi:predicted aldo/keto reductase-like oxidoreductase